MRRLKKAFKALLADRLEAAEKRKYIVSYPKSGATWLNFMLCRMLILQHGLDDNYSVKLFKLSAKLNLPFRLEWTHDNSHVYDESGNVCCEPEDQFLSWNRDGFRHSEVLFIIRDPRDIIVSLYHHRKNRGKIRIGDQSLSDFIRDPLWGFERIINFYEIWWHNRSVPSRFKVISYEDLLVDPVRVVRDVLAFLELEIDEPHMMDAIEKGRAENMRKLELNKSVEGMRVFDETNQNSWKVRRAKAGGYMDEMSEDDIAYCHARMKKLPWQLNYE
ncbi:MAG: sulfotransferase domain-containing protein [Verrucomicrobiota bacterium]